MIRYSNQMRYNPATGLLSNGLTPFEYMKGATSTRIDGVPNDDGMANPGDYISCVLVDGRSYRADDFEILNVEETLLDIHPIMYIKVRDWELVVFGEINEYAKYLYTNGVCVEFALELQRKLGGSCVTAYSPDMWSYHTALFHNNKYYDINGVHDTMPMLEGDHIIEGIPTDNVTVFGPIGRLYNESIVNAYIASL